MLEGAQIIGFDWKYKYVNDALIKHSKYTREELLGYTVQEKYPGIENTPTWQLYIRCFEKREAFHVENHFTFPDGSSGWFELSFQPIPDGIFILSIDITERKNIEEQLRQLNLELEDKVEQRTAQLAAVNKELEAFSYSVSHDLRAPLRAINGFSDMLINRYQQTLDTEAKRLLGVIKTNALNMGQLIDDLLSFSRTGRKEVQPTLADMQSLIQSVIRELTQNEPYKAAYITIHTLPKALCDMQLMRQVWLNLISNALKYTSKKEKPEIEISAIQNENETTYCIKDNGAGFDMLYADKLFGVFQRLHSPKEFEGNGVGLALVHRIISKHEGKVWAESEPDKGAAFYFTLKQ
ncbi:MAG: Adaptive-response sensory-kinase SasA [Bacteroidia bacterium]|nr:Adaptive-response sensory-kinase SasA [Bacteroidia bacterium]